MSHVVLTRDQKKDRPLARRLEEAGVPYVGVPLLKHAPGPDHAKLPHLLREGWDWVMVTSPTAAAFVLAAWEKAGKPDVRAAAIGEGTARVLQAGGMPVSHTSSKAYGSHLASGLGSPGRVLWPTSTLAGGEMEKNLTRRGFTLTRLDVYLTLPRELSEDEKRTLTTATVAALASPSAVRAWAGATRARPPTAAIGRVSAQAAIDAGFEQVWFPDNPGIEGWAGVIIDVYRRAG